MPVVGFEITDVSPHYPFWGDCRRVWELGLTQQDAHRESSEYFRLFGPAHDREDSFSEMLGYIDIHYLSPRIACHVLMAAGLRDAVCPPRTQFATYNDLSSRDKVVILCPDFEYEYVFNWNDHIYGHLLKMTVGT